ncbi:MAG: O-methyltransferase [Flavobacteriales bacterium]
MGDALFELRSWLRHRLSAGGPHQVHSPLVFRLLTQVLVPQKKYYAFEELNTRREALLKDYTKLEILDYGAGSRKNFSDNSRKVADIARLSLQRSHCAEALFYIIRDLQPTSAIELGTSLGLTTAYMAKGCTECQWTSMEGAPKVADFARNLLRQLDVTNVEIVTGNFDDLLPMYCSKNQKLDFAFIDGNHRYEPTMRYFYWLSPLASENAVFILDDIHWSPEMEKAWNEIQNSNLISVSIDFFHFGMIFFRSGIEKQKFILRLP